MSHLQYVASSAASTFAFLVEGNHLRGVSSLVFVNDVSCDVALGDERKFSFKNCNTIT